MSDGWSAFGKVAAFVVGLTAAGGVVYGIGTEIYDSGAYRARQEEEFKSRKVTEKKDKEIEMLGEQKKSLSEKVDVLTKEANDARAEGRLIPKRTCFRYTDDDGQGKSPRIINDSNCSPFVVRYEATPAGDQVESIDATLGNYRARVTIDGVEGFESQDPYKPLVKSEQ